MAGEIQLNSTTMATESSGTITLSNVNSATNRTNLGLGSMATQNANAVAITGGTINAVAITGGTINTVQPATGQSLTIKDEDGNTAITIGTDNTAAGYLSLNFGSYHGDSGGAGSGSLSANTLDDYEEGTFTPVYRGSSTAGTYSYSFNDGWYTKIGNVVHVSMGLYDITDSSEGSGDVQIAGLPFTSASSSVRTNLGGVFLSRFTLTGETYCSILSNGSNYVQIFRPTSGSGGTGDYLAITDRTGDGSDIGISITYQVD